MALKQKTLASIAALLKVKEADLKAAIDNKDETDISGFDAENHGLETFTADELSTRDTNAVKAKTKELQDAGIEIAVKKMKTATGFTEYEGKDPVEFVTKFNESALKKAKLEPSEQVKEKEKEISILKANLEKAETEKQTATQTVAQVRREMGIISKFPSRDGSLTDDERLALFNMRYEVKTVEGVGEVYVDKKTGQELRDKKAGTPLAVDAVLGSFWEEKNWKPAGGTPPKEGRGKGNDNPGAGGSGGSGGGTPVSWSEAREAWEAEGKNINSGDFQVYINKLATENQSFKMDIGGEEPPAE